MIARRLTILLTVAMAWISAPGASAQTADYPSGTIRFVCGFPPASGADVMVRHFAQKVSPLAGRNIIVENKPGAGGMLALTYTAKSKPDGLTVYLAGGNAVAANMHLVKNPGVDAGREIVVAATINAMPFMLAVDENSPHRRKIGRAHV